MRIKTLLVLLPLLCQALPAPDKLRRESETEKRAIYFLRVSKTGSNVVAIGLDSDGKLSDSTSVTSTQGIGLQAEVVEPKGFDAPSLDPLEGQQAVQVGDDYLFTVNSGSNTAVMFKINPENPLKLEMIGKPAPTLGEFPMSMAYSSKYKKACVLNGGAVNGVTCYIVSNEHGLVPDGVGHRQFGFPGTTPSQLYGKKGSGSDVQFSIDSEKLIAIYKGENKPIGLGHILIFDVDDRGNVAADFKDNQVKPVQEPYGFALNGDARDQFFLSDASFGGGALLSLDYDTNAVSLLSVVNKTAYSVSCWAVWSPVTHLYYDVLGNQKVLGKIDESGKSIGEIPFSKNLKNTMGATDTVVSGQYLYSLTTTNVIMMIDMMSGETVQQYSYDTAKNRPGWTGLAIYPASPILTGGL